MSSREENWKELKGYLNQVVTYDEVLDCTLEDARDLVGQMEDEDLRWQMQMCMELKSTIKCLKEFAKEELKNEAKKDYITYLAEDLETEVLDVLLSKRMYGFDYGKEKE